jgi:hypothetical protein
MELTRNRIKDIFDINYQPNCHPSRKDDVKAQEAIELLSETIDKLILEVRGLQAREYSHTPTIYGPSENNPPRIKDLDILTYYDGKKQP